MELVEPRHAVLLQRAIPRRPILYLCPVQSPCRKDTQQGLDVRSAHSNGSGAELLREHHLLSVRLERVSQQLYVVCDFLLERAFNLGDIPMIAHVLSQPLDIGVELAEIRVPHRAQLWTRLLTPAHR